MKGTRSTIDGDSVTSFDDEPVMSVDDEPVVSVDDELVVSEGLSIAPWWSIAP